MASYREIRAQFDRDSIVVYQAYRPQIADPAIEGGRFLPPFSWNRMTWIKPSFLWMMARSNWAQKAGQERILGVRILRAGWERALSLAALTSFDRQVHANAAAWRGQFDAATVHVQWDPERSIHGKKLQHRSIQVGLGRAVIQQYTDEWLVGIADLTPLAKKIRTLYLAGESRRAKELLPVEKIYPVSGEIARRLGMEA